MIDKESDLTVSRLWEAHLAIFEQNKQVKDHQEDLEAFHRFLLRNKNLFLEDQETQIF